MFPGGRISTPSSSLPAGWTAYTDVKTSKTYYVHLPTGDTQWTRPPPPPPPPPLPPGLSAANPFAFPRHTEPATAPYTFQFPSCPFSNGASAGSLFNGGGSGSNTARLSYYPNSNQTTLPPLPHPIPSFTSISSSQLKRAQSSSQQGPIPTKKRPRVQPKLHANHITPEPSSSRKWKECSKCKRQREWQFFSKKQWQSVVAGKCKSCVDGTVVDAIKQSRAAKKATTTSKQSSSTTGDVGSTTTTTTKCFRVQNTLAVAKKSSAKKPSQILTIESMVKACSECRLRGTKDAFSKRQWSTRIRKCKSCMSKYVSAKSKETLGNTNDDTNRCINGRHGSGGSNTQRISNSLASSVALAVAGGRVAVKQETS